MARLSLLLVIAAALVVAVTASPYGDDYHSYDGHHDGKYDDWNDVRKFLERVPKEVRALVKAALDFLVWRGVPSKKAVAYALQGVRVLLNLWGNILHKEKEFKDDIHALDDAKKEARHSLPWADKELKDAEKKLPDLVKCLVKIVTGLVDSLTGVLGGLGGHDGHNGHGGHGHGDGWGGDGWGGDGHDGHDGHGLTGGLPGPNVGKDVKIPGLLDGKKGYGAGLGVGGGVLG